MVRLNNVAIKKDSIYKIEKDKATKILPNEPDVWVIYVKYSLPYEYSGTCLYYDTEEERDKCFEKLLEELGDV